MHDLKRIEAELTAAGTPFLRDFNFERGEWLFIVDGRLVATGGALGLLEADVMRWWLRRA